MADHTPSALAVEDIVIPQGATDSATWPVSWDFAESDPLGVPTGWPGSWSARMQIRDYRGDGSTLLATLHSEDDADGVLDLSTYTDTTVTPNVGYARIIPQITPDVSSSWTWADQTGVFDLELTNGTRVIRLVEGSVTLSSEVTTVD